MASELLYLNANEQQQERLMLSSLATPELAVAVEQSQLAKHWTHGLQVSHEQEHPVSPTPVLFVVAGWILAVLAAGAVIGLLAAEFARANGWTP